MKLPEARGVLRRMLKARLKKLRRIDSVLGGSLVEMPGHSSRYLTDKKDGKTRTIYIPLDHLEEARRWNRNWKDGKRLLKEISEIQRALLREEIRAERR